MNNIKFKDYWFVILRLDKDLVKLKYKCLSVEDPGDILKISVSNIKIYLIIQSLNIKYD